MKLARIRVVALVALALALTGGAAWWLHWPRPAEDNPVAVPEPPANHPSGRVRSLDDEISWIGKALAADNREAARERAQETARRDRPLSELMDLFHADRPGGAIEPTLSRVAQRMPIDWEELSPSAHATAAVAEVLQFTSPPGSPSVIWNALRQELKEASYDWVAAVRARDPEQTQRAARRVQASCVECHDRYRHRPDPSTPTRPGPNVDLRAYKDDVAKDVVSAANLLMRGEYENARAWTDKIAENADCAEAMQLLTARKRGGLGMDATWPGREDDSIESALTHMEKGLPSAFRRSGNTTEMNVMGFQLAAIAEVVKALKPRYRMQESVWRTFTLEFRSACFELSDRLQQQDVSAIRTAAKRVNQACLACHAKVDVPLVSVRPRRRTTADLIATLDAPAGEGPKRATFLSYKRAGALEELASRKGELAKLGPPLAQALTTALADPDVAIRLQVVDLIARFHDDIKELSPVLRTILDQEKDEDVRAAATQVLGQLKGDDAVSGLIRALEDEDAVVRGRASLALGRLGKAAVPELRKLLKTGNRDTRASALNALGRIGPDAVASVPEVRGLIDGDEPLLKSLAADALRKIEAAK